MIMSDAMSDLILDLKAKYDYIILDTPPVGLVTDAIELAHFSDVTLYVVRQNYTKKEMITLLNNREQRGELDNISIVLNGFENKARYGYAYGYGYDYGYGNYSNGYHDVENNDNFFQRTIKNFLKK
jgi:Mrp family chromosome partitioning ATPase